MSKFEDILNRSADEIEEPTDVPEGEWLLNVRAAKLVEPKDEDDDPYFSFAFGLEEAGQGVSMEELELFEPEMKSARVFTRMYHDGTKRADWNMKRFFEKLGLEIQGKTIGDLLEEAKGTSVGAEVSHTPRDDGEGVYVNVRGFYSAEDWG